MDKQSTSTGTLRSNLNQKLAESKEKSNYDTLGNSRFASVYNKKDQFKSNDKFRFNFQNTTPSNDPLNGSSNDRNNSQQLRFNGQNNNEHDTNSIFSNTSSNLNKELKRDFMSSTGLEFRSNSNTRLMAPQNNHNTHQKGIGAVLSNSSNNFYTDRQNSIIDRKSSYTPSSTDPFLKSIEYLNMQQEIANASQKNIFVSMIENQDPFSSTQASKLHSPSVQLLSSNVQSQEKLGGSSNVSIGNSPPKQFDADLSRWTNENHSLKLEISQLKTEIDQIKEEKLQIYKDQESVVLELERKLSDITQEYSKLTQENQKLNKKSKDRKECIRQLYSLLDEKDQQLIFQKKEATQNGGEFSGSVSSSPYITQLMIKFCGENQVKNYVVLCEKQSQLERLLISQNTEITQEKRTQLKEMIYFLDLEQQDIMRQMIGNPEKPKLSHSNLFSIHLKDSIISQSQNQGYNPQSENNKSNSVVGKSPNHYQTESEGEYQNQYQKSVNKLKENFENEIFQLLSLLDINIQAIPNDQSRLELVKKQIKNLMAENRNHQVSVEKLQDALSEKQHKLHIQQNRKSDVSEKKHFLASPNGYDYVSPQNSIFTSAIETQKEIQRAAADNSKLIQELNQLKQDFILVVETLRNTMAEFNLIDYNEVDSENNLNIDKMLSNLFKYLQAHHNKITIDKNDFELLEHQLLSCDEENAQLKREVMRLQNRIANQSYSENQEMLLQKLEDVARENESLKEQILDPEFLNRVENEIEILTQDLYLQTQQCQELEMDLSKAQKIINQKQEMNSRLGEANNNQKEAQKLQMTHSNDLREEQIEKFQKELQTLAGDKQKLHQAQLGLKKKIVSLESAFQNVSLQRDTFRQDCMQYRSQMENYQQQLSASKSLKYAESKGKIDNLESLVQEQKLALEQNQVTIKQLEADLVEQNQEIKTKLETVNASVDQINQLEQQAQDQMMKINGFEIQILELNQKNQVNDENNQERERQEQKLLESKLKLEKELEKTVKQLHQLQQQYSNLQQIEKQQRKTIDQLQQEEQLEQNEKEMLESRVHQLQDEINQQSQLRASIESDKLKLIMNIDSESKELQKLRQGKIGEIEQLNRKIKELQSQISEKQQENRSLENNCHNLTDQLNEAENQQQTATRALQTKDREIEVLDSKIKNFQSSKLQYEESQNQMIKDLEEKYLEIQGIKQQLEDCQNKVSEKERQLNSSQTKHSQQLENLDETYQKKIINLEKQISRLTESQSERNSQSQGYNNQLHNTIKGLEEDLSQLKTSSLEENEKLISKISELEYSNKQFDSEVSKARLEQSELAKQLLQEKNAKSELEAQFEELTANIEEQREGYKVSEKELKEKLNDLSEEFNSSKLKYEKKIQQYNKIMSSTQAENDRVKEEFAQFREDSIREKVKLSSENEEKGKLVSEFNQTIAESQSENTQLMEEVKTLKQSLSQINQELQQSEIAFQKSAAKESELAQEYEKLQIQYRDDVQTYSQEVSENQIKMIQFQRDLATEKSQNSHNQNEIQLLQDLNASLENSKQMLEIRLQEEKTNNSLALQKLNAELELMRNKANETMDLLQKNKRDHVHEIQELESQIRSLSSEIQNISNNQTDEQMTIINKLSVKTKEIEEREAREIKLLEELEVSAQQNSQSKIELQNTQIQFERVKDNIESNFNQKILQLISDHDLKLNENQIQIKERDIKISETQSENEQLVHDQSKLAEEIEQQITQITQITQESEQLQENLFNLQKEKDNLNSEIQKNLNSYKNSQTDLNEKLENLKNENDILRDIKAQFTKLEKDYHIDKDEIQRLNLNLEENQLDFKKLQNQIQILQEKNSNSQKEIEKVNNQKSEMESKIERIQKKMQEEILNKNSENQEQFSKLMNEKSEEIDHLKTEALQLQKQLKAKVLQNEELIQNSDNLQQEIQRKENAINHLSTQLEDAKKNQASLSQSTLLEKEQLLENKISEFEKLKLQLSEVEIVCQNFELQLEKSTAEREDMKVANQELVVDKKSLQEQLFKLKEELNSMEIQKSPTKDTAVQEKIYKQTLTRIITILSDGEVSQNDQLNLEETLEKALNIAKIFYEQMRIVDRENVEVKKENQQLEKKIDEMNQLQAALHITNESDNRDKSDSKRSLSSPDNQKTQKSSDPDIYRDALESLLDELLLNKVSLVNNNYRNTLADTFREKYNDYRKQVGELQNILNDRYRFSQENKELIMIIESKDFEIKMLQKSLEALDDKYAEVQQENNYYQNNQAFQKIGGNQPEQQISFNLDEGEFPEISEKKIQKETLQKNSFMSQDDDPFDIDIDIQRSDKVKSEHRSLANNQSEDANKFQRSLIEIQHQKDQLGAKYDEVLYEMKIQTDQNVKLDNENQQLKAQNYELQKRVSDQDTASQKEQIKQVFIKLLESIAEKKTQGESFLNILYSFLNIRDQDKDDLLNNLIKRTGEQKQTLSQFIFKQ